MASARLYRLTVFRERPQRLTISRNAARSRRRQRRIMLGTHFINRRKCELVLPGMKCKARIGVRTGCLDAPTLLHGKGCPPSFALYRITVWRVIYILDRK